MKIIRTVLHIVIVVVTLGSAFAVATPARAAGALITVNTTADTLLDGLCSFQEAMAAATGNSAVDACPTGTNLGAANPDIIEFDIAGGGVQLITLSSSLNITDVVIIDGTSQHDYPGSPVIKIDGGNTTPHGLIFNPGSAGSVLKGLMVTRFTNVGVGVQTGNSTNYVTLQGNYIGTDGTSALANNEGVSIANATYAKIGGPSTSDRNVISGNTTYNIKLLGNIVAVDHTTIQGNYIGVNALGTAGLGGGFGIALVTSGTGSVTNTAILDNLISGHLNYGIRIDGTAANNTTITGNTIGTNAAGSSGLSNFDGIVVAAGSGTVIGGSAPGSGNLISGNAQTGIVVNGTAAGTQILGNQIGTDASGTGALANGAGINVDGVSAMIGDGGTPGRNLVSGNIGHGILIQNAVGTTIVGNRIGRTLDGGAALGNGGDGIYIAASGSALVDNNWIANNAYNGVYISFNSTVAGPSDFNCITDNPSEGVENVNSGVNAPFTNNWWGAASGPYHATSNPGGGGNAVTDYVDFDPVLTLAPAACAPLAEPSPLTVSFGNQLVGTSSGLKTVTLTNSGTLALNLTSVTTSAPFSISGAGTCPPLPGILAPGASCTIKVRFSPTAKGLITKDLTITSDAGTSPNIIPLSGRGVAGTQLLNNPSFETDANLDGRPDKWAYSNFAPATDGRDCGVHKGPGACSLRFFANNTMKTAKQTILKTGAAGNDFTLSLWSRAANIPAGSTYRLTVQFFNGGTLLTTKTKNFNVGTHGFQQVSATYTAPGPYTKIVFKISFRATGGEVWFDAADLRYAP